MKNLVIITFFLTALVPITAQSNSNNTFREKFQKAQQDKIPYFTQFGIISKNHKEFEKKYGIAVHYQNCVVSKYLSEKARENNKLVARTLTEKYGNTWKKDLRFLPYGL